MARVSILAVAFSAAFAVMCLGSTAVSAQEDCKEPVTSSGPARPLEMWAKKVATNMWRRQVQATYGETYEDIQYAKEKNFVCSPTSLGRRCTLTAIPCVVPGTLKDAPSRNPDPEWENRVDRALTRDLQTELQRVGCYRGPIDGDWGDGSRRAMERFARRTDVQVRTDEPSRRALRLAEEATGRVCRD